MSTARCPRTIRSIAEFLDDVRASRLLTDAQLESFASAWSPGDDPRLRALDLVEARQLTHFQSHLILTRRVRQLRIGRYQLVERLGSGGMGHVYKAVHLVLKRVVAIKIVARVSPRANRADIRANFRREAEAGALLRHPHIVTTYDAGMARGRLFLVMEHLTGLDLGRLVLTRGRLDFITVATIVHQVAQALQFAHERGLVHRDIKPANILFVANKASQPLVKLLDFGLAQRARAFRAETDIWSGTPDYMAPEQIMHPGVIDVRSDLYSLGCTVYCLLTGQNPFPGGTAAEKLERHQHEAPPALASLRPEVPPWLARVVGRLLAKDPCQRYQTPADLLHDLEAQQDLREQGPVTLDAPAQRAMPLPHRAVEPAVRTASQTRPYQLSPGNTGLVPNHHGFWRSGLLRRLGKALCAIGVGLLTACGIKGLADGEGAEIGRQADHVLAASADGQAAPFRVEGQARTFASLREAIDAAPDGGAILIDGPGPYQLPPLSLNKSLCLRSAAVMRPRLEKVAVPDVPAWQGLFTTDRPLTLENLALYLEDGADGPLVVAEGAAVTLQSCQLAGHGREPVLALWNAASATVHSCRVEGRLGLAAQLGMEAATRLNVEECTFVSPDTDSCALSFWCPEAGLPTALDVRLRGNTFQVGRALSFQGPRGKTRVAARENTFACPETLLAFTGLPAGMRWNEAFYWQGSRNQYHRHGHWVTVSGQPHVTGDPSAWEKWWGKQLESETVAPTSLSKQTNVSWSAISPDR